MKSYGLENVTLEPWTIPEGWERGKAVARLVEPDNGRPHHPRVVRLAPGHQGQDHRRRGHPRQGASTVKELDSATRASSRAPSSCPAPPRRCCRSRSIEQGRRRAVRAAARRQEGRGCRSGRTTSEMQAFAKRARRFLDEGRGGGAVPRRRQAVRPDGHDRRLAAASDRPSATNRCRRCPSPTTTTTCSTAWRRRPRRRRRGWSWRSSNKFIPGPIKVFNVVGEIKGSEKPDEVVVARRPPRLVGPRPGHDGQRHRHLRRAGGGPR